MHPFKSNRVAWSVALASLSLWAATAPVSWGAVPAEAARLLSQSTDETTQTTTVDVEQHVTITTDAADAQNTQCPTTPPTAAQPAPPAPTPVPAAPAAQGTFHICGADQQTAHAIEQLVAGH